MAEERVRTASEAVEALLSERGRQAKRGQSYERSLAEQLRLSDRIAELEGQPPVPLDEVVRRREAADARGRALLAEEAALRQRLRDAEEARERAELVAERLGSNARADAESRQRSEAARVAACLEAERRRPEELREAAQRAVTEYVRSSRMGARVEYYRRHARGRALLEADRVPEPYAIPPVGTFADDRGDPLEAWDVTEPGLVSPAEGVAPGGVPSSSQLESPRKRKRADESLAE